MTSIDRTVPPPRSVPRELPKLNTAAHPLANGIDMLLSEGGDQDLISIHVEVAAGSVHQPRPAVASLCAAMLTKGAGRLGADEIAEKIGFYGAHIQAGVTKEYAVVSLLTLNEHLPELLPLLVDTLTAPTFPQDELDTLCHRRKSRLAISLQDVRTLSMRSYSELMFGDTPYDTRAQPEDYDRVKSEDLATFHRNHYRPENARCYIAGKDTERAARLFAEAFEGWRPASVDGIADIDFEWNYRPDSRCQTVSGATQSAIHVGLPIVSAHHEDYPALFFLNTALGGHFGSRLMRNLRVEKGFTYGVRSRITELSRAAYLTISTEVGAEHIAEALQEITKELTGLGSELMPDDERDLVIHQVAGKLASALDGPFNRSPSLMSLVRRGLDGDHHSRLMQRIHELDAQTLKATAEKYFAPERLTTTVAGVCPHTGA